MLFYTSSSHQITDWREFDSKYLSETGTYFTIFDGILFQNFFYFVKLTPQRVFSHVLRIKNCRIENM